MVNNTMIRYNDLYEGGYGTMSVPDEELEQLVRHLNDKNKLIAKSFLSWLLEKQFDDEEDMLSPEDIQAIEQGRQELQNGETISLEDLKREIKL
jgi:hypothetical protein